MHNIIRKIVKRKKIVFDRDETDDFNTFLSVSNVLKMINVHTQRYRVS